MGPTISDKLESKQHRPSRFDTTLFDSRRNCSKNLQCLYVKNQDANLSLLVDGQPFTPPEIDTNTYEACSVDVLDPGFVLGMRYSAPDDNGKRDLLFAPLGKFPRPYTGRIFFSRKHDTNSRIDTGLVLWVETLHNGEAGKIFVISNPEDDERTPPFTGREALWRLLGKLPLDFAVAKMSRDIITQWPQDVPMELEVESLSRPEIVTTGSMARKRETKSEGALPNAPYPCDKARQGRI